MVFTLAVGSIAVATGRCVEKPHEARVSMPCSVFERGFWEDAGRGQIVFEKDGLRVTEQTGMEGEFLSMGSWRVSEVTGQVIRATLFADQRDRERIIAVVRECGGVRRGFSDGVRRNRAGDAVERMSWSHWRIQRPSGLTDVYYSDGTSAAFDYELTGLKLENPVVLSMQWKVKR